MAKTIDAAKREAGKKSAKKVKKNNRHVEAKPLMTLEEAREAVKNYFADYDETQQLVVVARHAIKDYCESMLNLISDDSEINLDCVAIDADGIAKSVALLIAANTLCNLAIG